MSRRYRFWIGFCLSLILSLTVGFLGRPVWSQPNTELLQQGRELYQTENFHQAASVLENAAQTFQHQG